VGQVQKGGRAPRGDARAGSAGTFIPEEAADVNWAPDADAIEVRKRNCRAVIIAKLIVPLAEKLIGIGGSRHDRIKQPPLQLARRGGRGEMGSLETRATGGHTLSAATNRARRRGASE